MIATKTIVPERKLKIKFTTKRIESDAAIRPCIIGQQVSLSNDCSMTKTSAPGTKKRGPLWVMEIGAQKEKRQKIDRSMMMQCLTILNKLMTHEAGWVFNQAVDPVALQIPDYFSIISNPMDLGTVKSKLEKNVYSHIEEFAADVRLTFSNAMLYNPPANDVHKMAKELNQNFEKRWKLLEEKCNSDSSKSESGRSSSGPMKNTLQKNGKTASLVNRSVPKRPAPSKEKVGRCSSEASSAEEVEHSIIGKDHVQKLVKNPNKGTEQSSAQTCSSATKEPCSPTLSKCGSCGHIACRCSRSSDTAHVSLSDISSERSLERDYGACSVDCRAKRLSTSLMRNCDPDSDVSTLDDGKACHSSQVITLVSDAASREDESAPPLDVQLSPQRALRTALLKCRFADTILKAQQKTLDHGDRNDPEKLKKERERLERRQREEKSRIEAEIRAAEAASREKAEIELKQQREREREAARVALEKMEKTVEIEQNLEALEELEILSGYTPSSRLLNRDNGRGVLMASSWPVYVRSPLEQLGLFIKAEYLVHKDEDDEAIFSSDGEEGEIFETT